MTGGGADVVIDCVGMDGKNTVVELIETAFKLQDDTRGPILIAHSACAKAARSNSSEFTA